MVRNKSNGVDLLRNREKCNDGFRSFSPNATSAVKCPKHSGDFSAVRDRF